MPGGVHSDRPLVLAFRRPASAVARSVCRGAAAIPGGAGRDPPPVGNCRVTLVLRRSAGRIGAPNRSVRARGAATLDALSSREHRQRDQTLRYQPSSQHHRRRIRVRNRPDPERRQFADSARAFGGTASPGLQPAGAGRVGRLVPLLSLLRLGHRSRWHHEATTSQPIAVGMVGPTAVAATTGTPGVITTNGPSWTSGAMTPSGEKHHRRRN